MNVVPFIYHETKLKTLHLGLTANPHLQIHNVSHPFFVMEIQKYKAKIKGTDTEVIGYITETREQLGQGTYGNGVDYLISVTEKSMPNGKYGTFKVDEESIKPIQNSKQLIDFIKWAERCGEDVFYIFDNPKDAVSRFLNDG